MEPFERRRKICKVAAIVMGATFVLVCLAIAIKVKSSEMLSKSLEGVQSAEADRLAFQWVFNLFQGLKAWGTVFCAIEIAGAGCIFYCLIEGIKPPKNAEQVLGEKLGDSVLQTPEEDRKDMVQKPEPEEESSKETIEQKVASYIKDYGKKTVIPYVYFWLEKNGCLRGASQKDFLDFVENRTGITTHPTHMSATLKSLRDKLNKPSQGVIEKQDYERIEEFLASFIKPNQRFNLKKSK